MIESDEGSDKASLPAQQTQQPQPAKAIQNDGWAARSGSLGGVLEGAELRHPNRLASLPPGEADEARFTAGVVRFYEAVLKEPIPEKMLRLIEEIAKQERNYE